MNGAMRRIRGSILVALFIAGAMVGGAAVFAQEDIHGVDSAKEETMGVTFPVAELGDCATKDECRSYCEAGEHMDQCIAFAKTHGLMNNEEVERSQKFSQRLKEKKTPGGCNSQGSCNAYCENITHLEECVAFAEAEDFKGEEFARGKQLQAYLKKGGTMPGGCTSRASCEAYCSDFSRAEECYRFAEAAGIGDDMGDVPSKDGGPTQKVSPEHLKRLGELAKKGETPGGCTNKEACMAYCQVKEHMEECITFGEKVGFMKKEEVDRARTFMTKGGPGGCTSQESCHAFCNEPVNQETCFKFAEENNLVSPEELNRMKEGWVRMRQGLENAPDEVRACVTSTLGATIIEDIQSGKLVPGPDIGNRVRNCFEKFGANHAPEKIFMDAPAEVKTCLKEKLGDQYAQISSGKTEPTPEIADTFRVCFQKSEFERQGWDKGNDGELGRPESTGEKRGPSPDMLPQFLRSAPPEIQVCLKEKLGDRFAKIQAGELMPGPEIGEVMRSCFENFRPSHDGTTGMERGMMMPPASGEVTDGVMQPKPPEGTLPPMGVSPQEQMQNFMGRFPPGSAACLKEKLGEEEFMKITTERGTPELEMAIRACVGEGMESAGMQGGGIQPPVAPPPGVGGTAPMEMLWTSKLPLPVQGCLRIKFGEQFAELGHQAPTPETEMAIRACYTEVAGGEMPQVSPLPPQEPMKLETKRKTLPQSFLGAVAAPFVALWHILR